MRLKIKSVKSLGMQDVYDIEVPGTHNFVLPNGVVAHNCSYSLVAYACMYLKTNYKLDWYKSILSNATKDDLTTKFWHKVQDFVSLPDINLSTDDYEIVGDKIFAPFSILTGVGEKAYESLIKHKPYSSLEQYCLAHFPTKEEELAKKEAKKKGLVIEDSGRKSAVTAEMTRKLIISGMLDSLFGKDTPVIDKLNLFEMTKTKTSGKKGAVPDKYVNMTSLDMYMIKKQLIPIYSQDIRDIILPNKNCSSVNVIGHSELGWVDEGGTPIIDGPILEEIKTAMEKREKPKKTDEKKPFEYKQDPILKSVINRINSYKKIGSSIDKDCPEARFACIGFVLSEKAFLYKDKTKQATRMTVDYNGYFTEEMFWPPRDQFRAPIGFKNRPCLIYFTVNKFGIQISNVIPLLGEISVLESDIDLTKNRSHDGT